MSDDPEMSGNGAAPPETNLVDLVIISGQSGAGKSAAMKRSDPPDWLIVVSSLCL